MKTNFNKFISRLCRGPAPQDPGEPSGETALAKRMIQRERERKNAADKKIEERKKERKKKDTGRPSFFVERGP